MKQTQAVLRSPAMQHSWMVEEEETLILPHPAWVGLEHNTISPASYADHTIQVSLRFSGYLHMRQSVLGLRLMIVILRLFAASQDILGVRDQDCAA